MVAAALADLNGTTRLSTQARTCWRTLQQMRLGLDLVPQPKVPDDLPAIARDSEYSDLWQKILDSRAYNFLLIDLSMIQLRPDPQMSEWESFAFYQCPHETADFDAFCASVKSKNERVSHEVLVSLYFEHVQTTPLRATALPVRYDSHPSAFKPGRHPACHVHLGHNTPLRVATQCEWKPLSFIAFVTRHFWPDKWIDFHKVHPGHKLFRSVRQTLGPLENKYFEGLANYECRLH